MKIKEIIRESDHDHDLSASLAETLIFIKNNGMTEIETIALISMVQRSGVENFSYQTLLDANEESELVKSMIKSIDPKKVKLAPDANQVINNTDSGSPEAKHADGENTVKNMAKSALK
jgi:hypothetical protein